MRIAFSLSSREFDFTDFDYLLSVHPRLTRMKANANDDIVRKPTTTYSPSNAANMPSITSRSVLDASIVRGLVKPSMQEAGKFATLALNRMQQQVTQPIVVVDLLHRQPNLQHQHCNLVRSVSGSYAVYDGDPNKKDIYKQPVMTSMIVNDEVYVILLFFIYNRIYRQTIVSTAMMPIESVRRCNECRNDDDRQPIAVDNIIILAMMRTRQAVQLSPTIDVDHRIYSDFHTFHQQSEQSAHNKRISIIVPLTLAVASSPLQEHQTSMNRTTVAPTMHISIR